MDEDEGGSIIYHSMEDKYNHQQSQHQDTDDVCSLKVVAKAAGDSSDVVALHQERNGFECQVGDNKKDEHFVENYFSPQERTPANIITMDDHLNGHEKASTGEIVGESKDCTSVEVMSPPTTTATTECCVVNASCDGEKDVERLPDKSTEDVEVCNIVVDSNSAPKQKMKHKQWRRHLRRVRRKVFRQKLAAQRAREEEEEEGEEQREERVLKEKAEQESRERLHQAWLERERVATRKFNALDKIAQSLKASLTGKPVEDVSSVKETKKALLQRELGKLSEHNSTPFSNPEPPAQYRAPSAAAVPSMTPELDITTNYEVS